MQILKDAIGTCVGYWTTNDKGNGKTDDDAEDDTPFVNPPTKVDEDGSLPPPIYLKEMTLARHLREDFALHYCDQNHHKICI